MTMNDLLKRIESETHPTVTTSELVLLQKYTQQVTEYDMLCGKLYKFNNKQLRIL